MHLPRDQGPLCLPVEDVYPACIQYDVHRFSWRNDGPRRDSSGEVVAVVRQVKEYLIAHEFLQIQFALDFFSDNPGRHLRSDVNVFRPQAQNDLLAQMWFQGRQQFGRYREPEGFGFDRQVIV